jgi:hypothetical protein
LHWPFDKVKPERQVVQVVVLEHKEQPEGQLDDGGVTED